MTPADVLAIVVLTLTGFLATNIDNLLILVALLGASRSRWPVLVGYGAAAAIVLAVCLLAGALGGLMDPEWVSYLGVIPIALGLLLGWRSWRERGEQPTPTLAPAQGAAGATFVLTLSNSGDNIALFLPLLAETERESVMLLLALYLALVLAWGYVAHLLATRPALAASLSRHGRWLLPCVMVAVGSYVLLDTTTDTEV